MGLSYNQSEAPKSEYKEYGWLGQPSPQNFEFGFVDGDDDDDNDDGDDDSWAGSKEGGRGGMTGPVRQVCKILFYASLKKLHVSLLSIVCPFFVLAGFFFLQAPSAAKKFVRKQNRKHSYGWRDASRN